ncbi:MAG: flavin reductase family protein [Pseudomonadota bacterium]
MSVFRFDALTPQERYKMLCAAVIPRPVAWITSRDPNGVVNAAPFSFFNVFSEDPALVIIGMNRRPGGERKDTLNNIETAGEFTVNIADSALAEIMVATAAGFPPEISEPEVLGLKLAPGETVSIPRLADAPVSLECALFEARALGPERHLVIGEVRALCARPGLFENDRKRMSVPHFDPVARLFATGYAKLSDPYDLPIPDWQSLSAKEDRG